MRSIATFDIDGEMVGEFVDLATGRLLAINDHAAESALYLDLTDEAVVVLADTLAREAMHRAQARIAAATPEGQTPPTLHVVKP